MPNKRIDQLPGSGNELKGDDLVPIFSDGKTERISVDDFASFSGFTGGGSTVEKQYFYTMDYDNSTTLPISDPVGLLADDTVFNTSKVENARATAPFLFEGFDHNQKDMTGGTKNFNFYNNMLFEVIEENGINVDGLQFTGHTSLSAYLTNNLTSTTANTVSNRFTVKMYGNRDNSLQKINKVRGINTFLSTLRGRGSYWRKQIKTGGVPEKLNNAYSASISTNYTEPVYMDNFLEAVYQRFLSTTTSGLTTGNLKRTIWFNQDPKKYYSLYGARGAGADGAFLPQPSGNRRCFNSNTDTFETGLVGASFFDSAVFFLDKNGQNIYYTSGRNLGTSTLHYWDSTDNVQRNVNPLTSMSWKVPIHSQTGLDKDNLPVNCISAIRIYKIGDGAGRWQFVVKPMGIDTILVDYIENNTDAELYGLFSVPKRGGKQVVVKFNQAKSINKSGNVTWRVPLDDYELFTLGNLKPSSNFIPGKWAWEMGRYPLGIFRNIRFFYGYPNGSISPVSDDELYHTVDSRGCPIKRLIRKNPIN